MPPTPPHLDAPKLVDDVLGRALAAGASDIYWLPGRTGVEVRIRVDGIQRDLARLEGDVATQCLTHIKVLGGLLTYRSQVAQDGVIRRNTGDGAVDLRVATMPTIHGERISLRVLARRRSPLLLDELGFEPEAVTTLRRMLARPNGLIVLTGPTGSGKSTTIYAMLRELLRQRQDPASILTLEDPVETALDGVSQTAVPPGKEDWTYEIALRAALRQDVKTLMVGEMRDRGVVKMVLDAALTGHRIVTTYHAGDIPSVYARILHQGFEPFLVAAAITGVVSQRLVRGVDGEAVPVVAVFEPDDVWREYVCGQPDLAGLRARLRAYPDADARTMADRLVHVGRLTREQAALLMD